MKIDERMVVLTTTKIIEFINNKEADTRDFELWIESLLTENVDEREVLRSVANSCNSYRYNKQHELMKLTPDTHDYFDCELHVELSELLRNIVMGYFNCL